MWFIIIALIENFTESVLINPGGVVTIMFLYAYLSLFVNILHKEQSNAEPETGIARQQ
jgi:hypothetical protein